MHILAGVISLSLASGREPLLPLRAKVSPHMVTLAAMRASRRQMLATPQSGVAGCQPFVPWPCSAYGHTRRHDTLR